MMTVTKTLQYFQAYNLLLIDAAVKTLFCLLVYYRPKINRSTNVPQRISRSFFWLDKYVETFGQRT
ncbi:hypothetical protein BDV25DRAFT_158648 [Aspergillus avenaceus]|uniref:Uncharacterized protein n=1 Tax=Aspergillus avenaceus TaxID=36643 RepID=A0A5N6TPJ9_ASPAV|nr:hypothetical protein BDV25DRAFT_158648 [Aspergillus avenaceus]